jgi:hypothetical protein
MTAQSWKSGITDLDSTPQELLGVIREDDNKVYKYIKFSGTTATVVNDFLCYVLADETCTTVDKANTAAGAGKAMATNAATGAVYYGWIQIRGVATLSSAVTAGAAGNAMTTIGSTAGKLDVSAAVTDQICAVLISVVAAAAPVVLLTCPN